MGGLWVVGELGPDGGLARISAETATLARELGGASGRGVTGIMVAAEPTAAADELARYLPVVLAITEPRAGDHTWSALAAACLAGLLSDLAPGGEAQIGRAHV